MASTFAVELPPAGEVSNFDNPSSLYPKILATVILCYTSTTLSTLMRLAAKRSLSSWELEDYFSVLAWIFNVAYDTLFLVQGQAGVGRHAWDVRATDSLRIAKLSWAIEILWTITIWLAKAALLLQLRRIFCPTKMGVVFWVIQCLIWVNLAYYASFGLAVTFECIPVEKIWNPLLPGGHCINTTVAILAAGSINVISDLMIFLLPIWAIAHLQMPLKRKIGITAIFATGLLACIASICRLAYSTKLLGGHDSTYIVAQVGLWTLAEIVTIILCTAFPMLPRLFVVLRNQRIRIPDPKDNLTIRREQHFEVAWNHVSSQSNSLEMQ